MSHSARWSSWPSAGCALGLRPLLVPECCGILSRECKRQLRLRARTFCSRLANSPTWLSVGQMDATGSRGSYNVALDSTSLASISRISVTAAKEQPSLFHLPSRLQELQPGGSLVADFCSLSSALVYCNKVRLALTSSAPGHQRLLTALCADGGQQCVQGAAGVPAQQTAAAAHGGRQAQRGPGRQQLCGLRTRAAAARQVERCSSRVLERVLNGGPCVQAVACGSRLDCAQGLSVHAA